MLSSALSETSSSSKSGTPISKNKNKRYRSLDNHPFKRHSKPKHAVHNSLKGKIVTSYITANKIAYFDFNENFAKLSSRIILFVKNRILQTPKNVVL